MGIFQRFGQYYDLIYQSIRDYRNECDALERVFADFHRGKTKSILDIACGTGSHALLLSKRGYDVTGIDASRVMIIKAREKAEKEKVRSAFHVQDIRRIKLNRRFDCSICMFGGFGYILTYKDLTRLFSGLRNHLKSGGLFVFHFWNLGGIKPTPYKTWVKAADENITAYRISETNLDPQTNIINLSMEFIITGKNKLIDTFSESHKLRCYSLAELQQYLKDNGFKLLAAYDWDSQDKMTLTKPRKETFGILAVARKT